MTKLKILAAGLALAFSAVAIPASSAVYVVAHPDDDILLMGPNFIGDITGAYPTVVIILTAGDAGNGHGATSANGSASGQYNNLNQQYYRIRMNARQDAIFPWVTSASKAASGYHYWTQADESFGGTIRQVERFFLGNIVEYHLNLPDDVEGGSTKLTNFLNGGPTATITDILGRNTYTQASLKETIRQIIARNNRAVPTLVVNFPDFRQGMGDHPDHTTTGQFVNDAINQGAGYGCMWQAIYPGYSIAGQRENSNLSETQRLGYERLHKTLLNGGNITPIVGGLITAQNHPTWVPTTSLFPTTNLQKGTMDQFHTGFYGRNYFRVEHPLNQSCAF